MLKHLNSFLFGSLRRQLITSVAIVHAVLMTLFIIDITDMKNPVQVAQYELDGPYGLGIKDHMLFVCDGSSGLKVYDKSDVLDLKSMGHYKDILTYDVIPLESHLLMIGDKILHQYSYNDQGVSLMSSYKLTD